MGTIVPSNMDGYVSNAEFHVRPNCLKPGPKPVELVALCLVLQTCLS